MKKLIWLALLVPMIVNAVEVQTFLCVGEAGTGVDYNTVTKTFGSKTFDMSQTKFIYKKFGDLGSVKFFHEDHMWLMCRQYLCQNENNSWNGSFFITSADNVFTAIWQRVPDSDLGVQQIVTAKGFCSEI